MRGRRIRTNTSIAVAVAAALWLMTAGATMQRGAGDHAVLPGHHIFFGAARLVRDVLLRGKTVEHLPVEHKVAERIHVRDGEAVADWIRRDVRTS